MKFTILEDMIFGNYTYKNNMYLTINLKSSCKRQENEIIKYYRINKRNKKK